jgi:hypothetical protein
MCGGASWEKFRRLKIRTIVLGAMASATYILQPERRFIRCWSSRSKPRPASFPTMSTIGNPVPHRSFHFGKLEAQRSISSKDDNLLSRIRYLQRKCRWGAKPPVVPKGPLPQPASTLKCWKSHSTPVCKVTGIPRVRRAGGKHALEFAKKCGGMQSRRPVVCGVQSSAPSRPSTCTDAESNPISQHGLTIFR